MRTLIRTTILLIVGQGVFAEEPQDAPLFDCVIEPNQTIELSSPVPGVIDRVLVDRSDRVKKGETLATLSSDVERAALALAITKAKFQGEVESAQATQQFAARKATRMTELYTKKAVPFQLKDEAETEAVVAAMNVRMSEHQNRIAKLELARAKALLERRILRSPIDGVVVEQQLSPGEYVEDNPVLVLAEVNPLRAEVILPVDYLGKLSPGMKAVVYPEAPAEAEYPGTVTVVDVVADAASGTFGVRVTVDNENHTIPAGVGCTVEFLSPLEDPSQLTVQY